MYISDSRLEALMAEDIPYMDLTTEVLGISPLEGEIEYFTREECLLCGSEEVCRIAEKLGLEVLDVKPSGSRLRPGDGFLRARGSAEALHATWKVCLNIFDHCSAIATKTASMVETVHAVNQSCEVLTTRKSMPGAKDMMLKAVLLGGAFPHRLGLSETVLVFSHHMSFMGGFDGFVEAIPQFRSKCIEKKIFVEANAEQARRLIRSDIDGIQFDKITTPELTELVRELREINPRMTLIASGGVKPENASEYAKTGVDGLVTTALFTARPIDMSVRMKPSA